MSSAHGAVSVIHDPVPPPGVGDVVPFVSVAIGIGYGGLTVRDAADPPSLESEGGN